MVSSIGKTVNKALTNKCVLYVVTFLAVINILAYLSIPNYTAVIFFILVAYLTQYFSKNMIVILLIAIISTSILFNIQNVRNQTREGLQNSDESDETQTPTSDNKTAKNKALENMVTVSDDEPTSDPIINKSNTAKAGYESIQDMIGNEGVQNLGKDTDDLIKRQKQLQESMESLKPMMLTANSMLANLDINTMEKLSGILGKFGGFGK